MSLSELLQQIVRVDCVEQMLDDRILGEALVVDEEEYEKHGVRRREGDPCDYVDRFRHPDRVGRLLFPHLDEACLGGTAIVGRVRTGTGSAGTARTGHDLVRSARLPFKARFHQPTFVELGLDRRLLRLLDATAARPAIAQTFLQQDAADRSGRGRASGGRQTGRLGGRGAGGSGRGSG